MKDNFIKLLAASALTAGMLAGCSGGSGSASGSGTAASADLGDTVKIGLNFELSGAVADYGNAELKGAKLAVKLFNNNPDKKFTVETVEIDNKSEPAESTSAATKLMTQDKVVGIVGPATSGASIATFAVSEQNAVPVVTPSATQNGAMLNGDKPYEYAWRVCFEDSYQGKAAALFAKNTLDKTKAVIFNEVSDYGQGNAESFKTEFESLGGTVVDQIQYNSGDQDFSSAITKIKGMDFDVIYVSGYYNEAGKIIKQAKDAGIDTPILGTDGFDSETLIDQAGKDYCNNVYFTTAYTAIDPSEQLSKFIEEYKAEYNENPGMFAALAFDATNLLLDELQASGKSGAELNEAIKKVNYTGVTGAFTFDESNHTPIKPVLVVELVNGEQSNVTPVDVK
ncbi:MAG: ABC transporter substrate-binding protein [Ileibacterium sp.]|nr:ABC transporter substrate-binding protein [Ileibacterium sp.]